MNGRRRRTAWTWIRALVGLGLLAMLVVQVGSGPFLDGVRGVDGGALAAALALGGLTTVGCAWRWRLIAAASA